MYEQLLVNSSLRLIFMQETYVVFVWFILVLCLLMILIDAVYCRLITEMFGNGFSVARKIHFHLLPTVGDPPNFLT